MTIDCLNEDPRWDALDLEALALAASDAALAELGLDPQAWEISLMGCDDDRIAALNADFRGKPTPTNVLSWPSDERGVDLAGKPMTEHVTHLIVHATLHLLGFDHERDEDATLMEGLETQILGKMGLDDPYRE